MVERERGAVAPVNPGSSEMSRIFEKVQIRGSYCISFIANTLVLPVYEEVKREFDLNRGEYLLLLCLSYYEKLTAQDIANMSGQPRNTISRSVHRALDKGYIERTADREDGRQAWLRLKQAGRSLEKKVSMKFHARESELFDSLDVSDRKTLDSILDTLVLRALALTKKSNK